GWWFALPSLPPISLVAELGLAPALVLSLAVFIGIAGVTVRMEKARHGTLETPPSAAELKAILAKLGIPARQLLRTGEDEYKALGLDEPSLGEEAIIEAMARHPKLIERPVLVAGDKAVVGRPPERVLEILV
ncbi:hypothetical protein M8410_15150, partial [Staphylococcus aureus]|nr:hypothetical protein [Staphylococcus aureus]